MSATAMGWWVFCAFCVVIVVLILRHKRDERFDDDADGGSSL